MPETASVATAKPRLLFFFRATDGRARRAEAFLAQVLRHGRNHGSARIDQIDVDRRPDLAARFRVASTPALIVIADGKAQGRLEQLTGCVPIRELLADWLR
jgi:thioredoxin-like negative regulator of GroEL